jgi:adenosylmethionine-8-amino-7-oxononanoate aminotransferase
MSDLAQRSREAVWHPCTQMKRHEATPPLPIVRAEGEWLFTADGSRIVDGISSWWVNLFGHQHPRIKAAIKDQLDQLEHVMLAGLTHAPVVELSERLAQLTGLGHAFYGSDGASATEIALKMSAHFWRNKGRPEKNRFVGLAGGYHGETVGALSVTDIAIFRAAYAPLARLSDTVPSPDARNARPGETTADAALRAAAQLEAWLQRHHRETAALIVEPLVQCAAGMVMHDASYLQHVRTLCDQYRVHLVVDEIAVGFGRTGSLFAHQQASIKPDFICLSKGLTGGFLPLSAVLTTDEVYAQFYDDSVARGFLHSHSYTGNPLACRAALAVLDEFASRDVLADNTARAVQLDALFAPISADVRTANARRLGMIWAWDVPDAPTTFAARFANTALAQGALIRPITTAQGATLYFMPPYCIGDDAAHTLLRATQVALDDAMASTANTEERTALP